MQAWQSVDSRLQLMEVVRAASLHPWPSGYTAGLHVLDGEYYERIQLDGLAINFHLAALQDRRGVGRHAKELLQQFRRMPGARDAHGGDVSKVYFYSTIHWCPTRLPENACVVIHDVTPMLYPVRFANAAREWFARYTRIARQAARIVTVSESSRRDVAKALGMPGNQIDVVPNGVTALPHTGNNVIQTFARPYFVFLGAIDPHKNFDVVLRAISLADEFDLVCVGNANNFHARLAAWPIAVRRRVHVLGYLDDEPMADVLSKALALVFPSLYEGFGLPPFEAALLGVPSICSNRPAMNRLLRSAAAFCHARRPEEWVTAMRAMHRDPNYRASTIAAARALAATFTWRRTAEGMVAVLRSLSAEI
jgi:glycosyltransferase involved in cell wall biosynthesis